LDPWSLICQWGVETAWGSAINNQNNLANIRCVSGIPCVAGFSQFPSLDSFCAVCVNTWFNGFYGAVLATAGHDIETQLVAIGKSPWDAGHYNNGGGPGSSLITAAEELQLLMNTGQKEAWIQTYWLMTTGRSAPDQNTLSNGDGVRPGANQVANDGSNLNSIFAQFYAQRSIDLTKVGQVSIPAGTKLNLSIGATATVE